jgi:hypothetical protein
LFFELFIELNLFLFESVEGSPSELFSLLAARDVLSDAGEDALVMLIFFRLQVGTHEGLILILLKSCFALARRLLFLSTSAHRLIIK